jgi:hypothetical protein
MNDRDNPSNQMGPLELLDWAYNVDQRFDVMPADWKLRTKNLLAAPRVQATQDETTAVQDVLAERQRQQVVEGYSPAHDDGHPDGSIAKAASCYALCAGIGTATAGGYEHHYEFAKMYAEAACPSPPWPWDEDAWKPKSPRRDLVRAAALILAEIERLDRRAVKT